MPVGLNSEAPAVGAPARDAARLAAEIDDLFLPDDARLDDRTRLAITRTLGDIVDVVERDIRRGAARLLAARGDDAAAEALIGKGGPALDRLHASGVLRDPELMAEVIAQARLTLIAAALPAIDGDERPSLLLRLTDTSDGVVAGAARALLAADARARHDLPAELHHRLTWWVAAAIRRKRSDHQVDRALADAALRCLAAHDEGDRPEALAARLATAIDPLPAEVPALLIDALGDRRPTLFVAVLARAVGIDGDVARAILLDPDGTRLWAALRAIGMARVDIARVALALAEADPRRDIEAFADRLDAIAAIAPDAGRATIAPLTLPRDFRLAIAALGRRV